MRELVKEGLERAGGRLSERRKSISGGSKIVKPTDRDQLWTTVKTLWGIEIPRVACCADHCAPFDAFADAYFAVHPITVWHASRGLGGKSMLLATLALTEAAVLGTKTNLLGGSGEQAERVLKYMYGDEIPKVMWDAPKAPKYLVRGGYDKGALKKETILNNGGYIRALMASSRSVRGPHPERLRLDEVDEMDLDIFDAAMGQTMAVRGIPAQTVCSSTWHNADGTMTEILRRAEKKGWPLYQWCYKENLASVGGWLPEEEVARKQSETTEVMFRVEYDLQEPNPESRAIDPDAVKDMFREELGVFKGELNERIQIEEPEKDHIYLHAADWAKRKDFTVITTWKLTVDDDNNPEVRLVEFLRTGRKPWPYMVGALEDRHARYEKAGAVSFCGHDETGVGDVVGDYITIDDIVGIWLTGRLRYTVFNDYVSAVEHGYVVAPDIEWMRKEHEYCGVDDLFGQGHPPDTIVSSAVGYYIAKNMPRKKKARATWGA